MKSFGRQTLQGTDPMIEFLIIRQMASGLQPITFDDINSLRFFLSTDEIPPSEIFEFQRIFGGEVIAACRTIRSEVLAWDRKKHAIPRPVAGSANDQPF